MAKKIIETIAKAVNPFDSLNLDSVVLKASSKIITEKIVCPNKEGKTKTERQGMRKAYRDEFERLVSARQEGINAVSFDVRDGDSVYRHYLITKHEIPEKLKELAHELIIDGVVVKGTRKAIKRLM